MTERAQPAFVDNPVMQIAFRDYVMFLWGQTEAHDAFREQTGMAKPKPPASRIGAMIDEATGVQDAYALAFLDWTVREHWGEAGVGEGDD